MKISQLPNSSMTQSFPVSAKPDLPSCFLRDPLPPPITLPPPPADSTRKEQDKVTTSLSPQFPGDPPPTQDPASF